MEPEIKALVPKGNDLEAANIAATRATLLIGMRDKRALFALRNEATTVYWCLLTMSPSGPDDGLVHANRCGADRACCEPEPAGENVG